MKLREYKDASGKKVTVTTKVSIANKSPYGSFKNRLTKLVDYAKAHKWSKIDKVEILEITDDSLKFIEQYDSGVQITYDIYIGALTEAWKLKIYSSVADDIEKPIMDISGMEWVELLKTIRDYIIIPVVGTPEYKELLVEYLDNNGKKVTLQKNTNTSSTSTVNKTSNTSSNKDKFIKLIYNMMRDKISSVTDVKCLGVDDNGFTYKETRSTEKTGEFTLTLKVSYGKDSKWTYALYIDNSTLIEGRLGKGMKELLHWLSNYFSVPAQGSKEYDSICESLEEWIDSGGKKVTTPSSNISTQNNSQNNSSMAPDPKDQTERYKKLLAKIDSEKKYTYQVKELSNRLLSFVIDNEFKKQFIRILYSPTREDYLVQYVGSHDMRCDHWKTVLQSLVGMGVIKDTSESLDSSFGSAELREYVDSSGKKVNIGSSSCSQPAQQNTSSKVQGQTKRYSKLIKQIKADGIATCRINDLTDTTLDITVDTKKKKDLNIKIIYEPTTNDYTFIVGKGTPGKGWDYEKDILDLLVAGGVISNTDLCESCSLAEDFQLYETLWD